MSRTVRIRGFAWRPILFTAASVMSIGAAAAVDSDQGEKPASCPATRSHIESHLQTRPEDGGYYTATRNAVRKPVADLIRVMGGRDQVRAFATITKTKSHIGLSDGASGAERRYHADTILRSDALIAILDCLDGRT